MSPKKIFEYFRCSECVRLTEKQICEHDGMFKEAVEFKCRICANFQLTNNKNLQEEQP